MHIRRIFNSLIFAFTMFKMNSTLKRKKEKKKDDNVTYQTRKMMGVRWCTHKDSLFSALSESTDPKRLD